MTNHHLVVLGRVPVAIPWNCSRSRRSNCATAAGGYPTKAPNGLTKAGDASPKRCVRQRANTSVAARCLDNHRDKAACRSATGLQVESELLARLRLAHLHAMASSVTHRPVFLRICAGRQVLQSLGFGRVRRALLILSEWSDVRVLANASSPTAIARISPNHAKGSTYRSEGGRVFLLPIECL